MTGRPTGYQESYPEELFNLMKEGKKGARLHAHFGVHRKTFWEWLKKYPEFNEAYERGLEQCEEWWERFGVQKMIEGDEKGYKYFQLFMGKNFGVGKGADATTNINIGNMNVFKDMNKDQLIAQIREDLKELPVLDTEYETISIEEAEEELGVKIRPKLEVKDESSEQD